ncbi:transcription/translation regulatory transformer protein RfaH [Parasalinivibrio latis]|uniref:transcription/translation regulatory transformer protein RfaH n=1 Tax=Parasalinivibrio latis TaxID=2952610 RepID=UPI0030DE612F
MRNWHLLYCKRGEMDRAEEHLRRQGIDSYYPKVTVQKLLRGKRKQLVEPLFPNYLFVQFNPEEVTWTTVRSTRGVCDFVRCGREPVRVDITLVKELMIQEDCDEQRDALSQDFKSGQVLTIREGCFQGLEAIYQEPDGEKRSFLLINLINKPTKVCLDNELLQVVG